MCESSQARYTNDQARLKIDLHALKQSSAAKVGGRAAVEEAVGPGRIYSQKIYFTEQAAPGLYLGSMDRELDASD